MTAIVARCTDLPPRGARFLSTHETRDEALEAAHAVGGWVRPPYRDDRWAVYVTCAVFSPDLADLRAATEDAT